MQRTVAAVPEEVVRLRVNGQLVATWSGSPVALEALAAGRLLTMGFLRSAEDLLGLRVSRDEGGHSLDAQVEREAAGRGLEDRRHRREHGCGLRFLITCRPDRLPPRGAAPGPPEPGIFPALFRELFERSPSRREAGGHHTAALSDGSRLVHVHEEVGRHNGVDKVLGAALMDGTGFPAHGILTTARISGEIAEKAARAGVGWIASRSVPTTLAVEVAAAAGVALIGRAASPDARVFRGGSSPGEAGAAVGS
jgi:FdhD protein